MKEKLLLISNYYLSFDLSTNALNPLFAFPHLTLPFLPQYYTVQYYFHNPRLSQSLLQKHF